MITKTGDRGARFQARRAGARAARQGAGGQAGRASHHERTPAGPTRRGRPPAHGAPWPARRASPPRSAPGSTGGWDHGSRAHVCRRRHDGADRGARQRLGDAAIHVRHRGEGSKRGRSEGRAPSKEGHAYMASGGGRSAVGLKTQAPSKRYDGAGEGNRTLVFSLEGCCSTIELHPRGRIVSMPSGS